MTALYEIASGLNSGFSTVSNYKNSKEFDGIETWGRISWSGLKTAVKAHTLCKVLFSANKNAPYLVWGTFSVWLASYTISALASYKGQAMFGCGSIYEPNSLVRLSKAGIAVSRVALAALEATIRPIKGAAQAAALYLYSTNAAHKVSPEIGELFDRVVPTVAKIGLIAFGSPLTKTITSIELAASFLSDY